jgi:peptidoglycan-associated lipoprotein
MGCHADILMFFFTQSSRGKTMTVIALRLSTIVSALMLVACSSVPLDTAPVEDKKPMPVASAGASAAPGGAAVGQVGTAGTAVKNIDLGQAGGTMAGPMGAKVVYFDYDSFVVKSEFQSLIETHAKHLKADKSRRVNVEGHTDERGGREYNLALGQKRAEAVRRSLTLLGVAEGQMEAVSFGKEKLADSGANEAAWAKNRRVELTYR